jgi:hypothetical protein
MCLEVPDLRFMEDLADVINWFLDGPGVDAGSEFSGLCPSGVALSTTNTMLTASVAAAMYKYNVSPGSGATRIDREVMCCFNSWKACSASLVQAKGPDFRRSLKKGRALSASLEMKRLRAAKDPISF